MDENGNAEGVTFWVNRDCESNTVYGPDLQDPRYNDAVPPGEIQEPSADTLDAAPDISTRMNVPDSYETCARACLCGYYPAKNWSDSMDAATLALNPYLRCQCAAPQGNVPSNAAAPTFFFHVLNPGLPLLLENYSAPMVESSKRTSGMKKSRALKTFSTIHQSLLKRASTSRLGLYRITGIKNNTAIFQVLENTEKYQYVIPITPTNRTLLESSYGLDLSTAFPWADPYYGFTDILLYLNWLDIDEGDNRTIRNPYECFGTFEENQKSLFDFVNRSQVILDEKGGYLYGNVDLGQLVPHD